MGEYLPIPALTSDGDLPRGRFCTSLDDVEKRFVADAAYEGSITREKVWTDFNVVLDTVRRRRVRVPAVFLGGGFVTSELNPSDVDVALIIDVSKISNPQTYADVAQVVDDPKAGGLRVDAFLIPWHPDGTELGGGGNTGQIAYATERARWDDFWQRKVPKIDRHPPQRWHSMPVRGYLEVVIDGYR